MVGASKPPVIFTPRSDLRDAVRAELKAMGIEGATLPDKPEACIEELIKVPEAVLIIDWQFGSEVVNQVLGAIRGHFKIETRPIFLIIPEIDAGVVAVGAEYGVSQVHSGAISRTGIRECLDALYKEDETTKAIRATLVQVATARAKGDWAIATPLLQELNKTLPGQERVIVELAENLIHENNWQEALNLLAPLVQAEPPNVRAIHLSGRCYMAQGDFDQAIGLLSRAKLINPHNVERLIDLGNSFLKNDQIEEAQTNFQEALAVDGANKDAKVGSGTCMLMSGEVNEGLGLLKTVSGPRELASIFNTAAVLAMRQGRFDQGMSLYKSAMTAVGRDDKIAARLMFNMGLGYKRWQKPDKAVACFEKSLALDPTYDKAAKHKEAVAKTMHAGAADPNKTVFSEEEFTDAAPGEIKIPSSDE